METSIDMDKPKNRIKEVLEERGIKQTWLAERLGKSFCIVNSYVCNRRQPSLDVLFEIAKILNVDQKSDFRQEFPNSTESLAEVLFRDRLCSLEELLVSENQPCFYRYALSLVKS